jgi:hypothetical protein
VETPKYLGHLESSREDYYFVTSITSRQNGYLIHRCGNLQPRKAKSASPRSLPPLGNPLAFCLSVFSHTQISRTATCHTCLKCLSATGTEFSTAVLVTQISALKKMFELAAKFRVVQNDDIRYLPQTECS